MGQALLQSGRLIIGVLSLFALFMAALVFIERGEKQKRRRHARLRGTHCERPGRAV